MIYYTKWFVNYIKLKNRKKSTNRHFSACDLWLNYLPKSISINIHTDRNKTMKLTPIVKIRGS